MSTGSKAGQILFVAFTDMPKTGFSHGQISKAMDERGWPVKASTLSAKLSLLTNKGLLVKTSDGYRLPGKVSFVKA